MRESKIQYNPALSVKENAKKNDVSEAAIRYYIKTNLLDRRFDRKQNIISDCKKYLSKHPKATRTELQKKTGHSLSTIRQYWEYITTEKELTDFDSQKEQKRLLRQVNNFYATHPSVTQDILRVEDFHTKVLEPFCGTGTMAEVIKNNGHEVEAYDIIDRGYGKVGDFFKVNYPKGEYDIITNPPYDRGLNEIIKRCLCLCKNKFALLLTLNYLTGKERFKEIYGITPPKTIYVYTERIDVARNGEFEKYAGLGTSMTNYAWYVWERGYNGSTELKWIHNKQESYNPVERPQNNAQKTSKKELWSDALRDTSAVISTAEKDNIKQLRKFLFEKPEMPMLFVGSGGMNGSFAALLYGMNAGIGKAVTPLQFASLSEKTIKNSRILLMSKGGKNDDIVYATKRAVKINPENTACFTTCLGAENRMVAICEKSGTRILAFHHPEIKDGYTLLRGKFLNYALLHKAFTGIDTLTDKLRTDVENPCFHYELNNSEDSPVRLKKIAHFIVLYGSYGEPVAMDFESSMAEIGVASVQPVDYRNFCHGRFIFPSNHTENDKEPRYFSDAAVVLLISPREVSLATQVREKAIASNTPVITIETAYDSPLAVLDLLIKSNYLIAKICEEEHGINPYSPENYGGVDKRFPINGMSFIEDLLSNGNLTYKEPDYSKRETLKRQIETIIEEERSNTKQIENSKLSYPRPTRSDLFKTDKENYDASKYLCYAFRRKGDLHKDFYFPLGNMNNGFAFRMNDVSFYNSECAYICGLFSNNSKKHIEIQKELIAETNGYAAKKTIRAKHEEYYRKDWEEFNVDWMLYCIWNKVRANEEFRNILLSIPREACIIENSTFQQIREHDTASYWGCRNERIKEFGRIVKSYSTYISTRKSEREDIQSDYLNNCCNLGEFIGNNTMGKILMIVKDCLHNGTEPEIDYQLLKSKKIYLLGKLLSFNKKVQQ